MELEGLNVLLIGNYELKKAWKDGGYRSIEKFASDYMTAVCSAGYEGLFYFFNDTALLLLSERNLEDLLHKLMMQEGVRV